MDVRYWRSMIFIASRKKYIKDYLTGAVLFVCIFGAWETEVAAGAVAAKPKVAVLPPLEIAGWIPYWKKDAGTAAAIEHMDIFTQISPFGYTVKNNGTLFDAMKIDEYPWLSFVQAAHDKKVWIIPTVTWSNTKAIHAILKSSKLRKAHVKEIVRMVKENKFDGVDIDYEGKKAETKKYFSLFLKELYAAMGKKWVVCTIEARTPLNARFDTIPKDISFANDYVAINNYCDRVRIMAYDQGSIDLRLNEAELGPYVPVADPRWVEKTIRLAMKTIAKKKIIIGIPTYGYEYRVTPLNEGYRYDMITAFNPRYAMELAEDIHIVPTRNSAGELSFMYTPSTTIAVITASGTPLANNGVAAAAFSQSAVAVAARTPFNILWWSDAAAIKEKVALARKLGVRGVAIFKIDGGGDSALWDALRQ